MKKIIISIAILMELIYIIKIIYVPDQDIIVNELKVTKEEIVEKDINKEKDIEVVNENNYKVKENGKIEKKDNLDIEKNNIIDNVQNDKEQELPNKIIKNIEVVNEQEINYLFGVKIIKNIETKEYFYDDNTNNKKINTYYEYDRSNYNVSDQELKNIARSFIQKNIAIAMLEKINHLRNNLQKSSLNLDEELTLYATMRAMELAYSGVLAHTRANGLKWNSILGKKDYSYAGENIGWYYNDINEVFLAWKASKGHYLNMINNEYNKVGIGYFNLNGDKYWVQIFTDK